MAMSGQSGDYNSDINVTPLVDVMLVLLVVFMITAPMLNTGVDVDLPEVEAENIEDPEGKLILSIDKTEGGEARVFLGATPVKWADLGDKLRTNERVQKERELYIEAHHGLPYSVVVTAMAVAQKAGVSKLQMLTEAGAELDLEALDQGSAVSSGEGAEGAAP